MLQSNVLLKNFTNYKIGGPARYFLEFATLAELEDGLRELNEIVARESIDGSSIFILSGGTNLLVSDIGFDGLVLHNKIDYIKDLGEGRLEIGAGVKIEDLNNYLVEHSLSGLEWSGGLPGTLGGAIFGNAGAFGGEMKDKLLEVESYNIESHQVITRNNDDCKFAYRNSIFKKNKGKEIILSGTLKFVNGDRSKIKAAVDEKNKYRRNHQPLEYPNAGSTFKNVDLRACPDPLIKLCQSEIKNDPFPVIPAAYLIHLAGLQGMKIGDAQISEKHPNFIINRGNATATDVENLIELVRQKVAEKFGVNLETEIIRL